MKMFKMGWGVLPAAGLIMGLTFYGCEGKKSPTTPSRPVALTVKLPMKNIHSSLLGAAQNELIYRFDSSLFSPQIEHALGPFTTPAADGEYDFAEDVPAADGVILSIQINDAATHQPLALGATRLDLATYPTADVVVDMGSLTRNCYYTQMGPMPNGGYYNFATDVLGTSLPATTGVADIQILPVVLGGPVTFQDAWSSPPGYTISYMGNGNLVDFDYWPSSYYFYQDSYTAKGAPVQAGDIFCLEISSIPSSLPPTLAWIQITDAGGVSQKGPSFIFRTNTIHPYYAYEQTPIDLQTNGVCVMGH